jgi:predicted DNA-binding ribbon-helix-helix protein
VGRFWRYLERIACFDHARLLALYWKLESSFQDVGRFDSRMRVPPDCYSRLYRRLYQYCHITRSRAVGL